MGEATRDPNPKNSCEGSGKAPTSSHESIGRVAATWGRCPVCQGSYRVDSMGLLVTHRSAR